MSKVQALAAHQQGGAFEPFEYDLGDLGPEEVEIAVETCGICHSDVAMWRNEWGMSEYPVVPGHEIVGRIVKAGRAVKRVKEGDRVGLGWFSESCLHCHPCLSGDHNMCVSAAQTIVGRFGGWADKVRCHWVWATPIPDGIDAKKAGPLFCGGITVFNPIVQANVRPTAKVGVIGIGGLGHLALQFLSAWGCEVTAFTSSAGEKGDEAKAMGAHHVVDSKNADAIREKSGYDFILSTVTASLDWDAYVGALGPRGRLHLVGVPEKPLEVQLFPMITSQAGISGSPLGSPATTADMLAFCERHGIAPMTDEFKMSKVNDALAHLEAGRARYRVVLEQDLA